MQSQHVADCPACGGPLYDSPLVPDAAHYCWRCGWGTYPAGYVAVAEAVNRHSLRAQWLRLRHQMRKAHTHAG